MEQRIIENDIHILYVTASSFPEGILDAFEKLHVQFPSNTDRRFFGLSRPENEEGIVYRAAAELKSPDDSKKSKFDTMVIARGTYISETIFNFKDDPMEITRSFEKLLEQPNIDPLGYCVEWYLPNDKDVICMIRLE